MVNKIVSSLLACSLMCCTISTPTIVNAKQDSIEDYMIFDPEDYDDNVSCYNEREHLYKSENCTISPSELPVNECILGLDESVIKVMIDPGHCGYENRSPVYSPYYESVMTWKLSNYLQEELTKLGVHADLTKSSLEEEPALQTRGHLSKNYDFFISIHSNAASYSSMDKPIALCYQNLDWTTIDDTSREIGQLLASKVAEVMQTNQKGEIFQRKSVEDRDGNGVWDDEWYGVLCGARYVSTPGILLEHSFHTNYRATVWLYNEDNLKKLAKEEAAVIFQYFSDKKAKELSESTTTAETMTTAPSIETTTETTTTTIRIDPKPIENGMSGDVDGDGAVTITDASFVLEYYSRKAAGFEPRFIFFTEDLYGEELIFKAADINDDKVLDISDATGILLMYAKYAAGVE
ncbi:MAG: N-acetylmuramoyl-L-alanine amidase [Ruminococcus sp.]|nr:N-acetylmuramoyl-L-alanine amidase [Ruminococcus sp.]